jgi:hypothetical protein
MAGAAIEEIRPGQICVVAKGDPGGHPEKVIGPPGLRRPSRWGDASAYCSNTSLTIRVRQSRLLFGKAATG